MPYKMLLRTDHNCQQNVMTTVKMPAPTLSARDRNVAGAASRSSQYQSLYRRHQWFDLRDAVCEIARPGFFRGAVACAFNEFPKCLDYLIPVIESAPNSQTACHAHDLLTWAYMREGKFRSALAHREAMLAISPQKKEGWAAWSLLSEVGRYSEQSVRQHHPSVVPYEMVEGSMFIPAAVNGTYANFMVDSGATISMITQSYARRLGLRIHAVDPEATRVYGATGVETGFHITVAMHLDIGNCRLSNVTFIVLKDERFQFPAGYGGALGLPVLIALQTLSWNTKGEFHAAFPTQPCDVKNANICFDGPEPVIDATFRHERLPLILDTGNSSTIFGPLFAGRFADLVSYSGHRSRLALNGVSGSADVDSVRLSRVALQVDGFKTILRPAHVLLSTTTPNSNWLFGRLGIDCLNQAACITLDFNCMKLTLRQDEL